MVAAGKIKIHQAEILPANAEVVSSSLDTPKKNSNKF